MTIGEIDSITIAVNARRKIEESCRTSHVHQEHSVVNTFLVLV